ncbi:hypothetical protein C8Q77DRAFT_1162283 [Trametes polyzona]|nr:hypothetical protein C8Q77DRAFT_1162283 [Trametes polyzona]
MSIQPLFIDMVGKDFGLEERQIEQLRTFAELGSLEPAPLSLADLGTRIYALAATFGQNIERKRAAAAGAASVEDLPALFNDLKIRLEDGFLLTAQQRANILAITQDVVYQPHQLRFKTIVGKIARRSRGRLSLERLYKLSRISPEALRMLRAASRGSQSVA